MPTIDPELVLEQLEELYELIDKAVEARPKNETFYESVRERAQDIEAWIRDNEVATLPQSKAVTNWLRCIEEQLERK